MENGNDKFDKLVMFRCVLEFYFHMDVLALRKSNRYCFCSV